jgi:hypothetical protein
LLWRSQRWRLWQSHGILGARRAGRLRGGGLEPLEVDTGAGIGIGVARLVAQAHGEPVGARLAFVELAQRPAAGDRCHWCRTEAALRSTRHLLDRQMQLFGQSSPWGPGDQVQRTFVAAVGDRDLAGALLARLEVGGGQDRAAVA